MLTLMDNIINIIGSLFGKERTIDVATSYLYHMEISRIDNLIEERNQDREEKAEEALKTMKKEMAKHGDKL